MHIEEPFWSGSGPVPERGKSPGRVLKRFWHGRTGEEALTVEPAMILTQLARELKDKDVVVYDNEYRVGRKKDAKRSRAGRKKNNFDSAKNFGWVEKKHKSGFKKKEQF